jgi:hypothetical protein
VLRSNALQHVVALRIEQEIPQLEQLLRTFHERTGRYPTNFEEMVAAGWLRSVPLDPTGQAYRITPEGRVEPQTARAYVRKNRLTASPSSNQEQQAVATTVTGAQENTASTEKSTATPTAHRRQRRHRR